MQQMKVSSAGQQSAPSSTFMNAPAGAPKLQGVRRQQQRLPSGQHAFLPKHSQKLQTAEHIAERSLPWQDDHRRDSRYKNSSDLHVRLCRDLPVSRNAVSAHSLNVSQCFRGTCTRKSGRERTTSISGPCGSCSLDVADTFTWA